MPPNPSMAETCRGSEVRSEAVADRSDRDPVWRKSTGSDAGACIEVATLDRQVFIRYGADPRNTAFAVSAQEWAAFLEGVRAGEFDLIDSETDSSVAGQMEIDIYLDTDEESVASSVFIAIDALAKALGVEDIALTEIRRGSFIRRSKASLQAALSDAAVQQRLQSLERFIELWQVDPRQAEVDQRTSEPALRAH